METGQRLKVSSDRLVKPGIDPATPGLQGKRFIHYTTAAPAAEHSGSVGDQRVASSRLTIGSHCVVFSSKTLYYPPTKSEGYSFGVVHPSVHSVRPSGTISQYLLVRFDSFLVQMISTMDSQTSNKFGQNQPLNT